MKKIKLFLGSFSDTNRRLDTIDRKLEQIMATLADFQNALAQIDAETTRIGVYIESIVTQLNRTDLTEEQETALHASLQAAADKLKGVGASVTTPIPPIDLPPV